MVSSVPAPKKKPDTGLVAFAFSSRVRPDLPASEIGRIVRQAWANNVAAGISGVLMYSDGTFREVIEGSTDAVQRAAANIIADHRHGNIEVTRFESIETRVFDNWRTIGFEPFFADLPSEAVVSSEDIDTVIPVLFGQSEPG